VMLSEWMVSKDRVAYYVPHRAALDAVVEARKIKGKEAGNLRQLMGIDQVGSDRDDRDGRHDSDNWQRYHAGFGSSKSVQCIRREGSDELVILLGKLDHRWHLAKQHAPAVERSKLARLLNGSVKEMVVENVAWIRGVLPPAVGALHHGQCVATLAVPQVDLPDYGAQTVTVCCMQLRTQDFVGIWCPQVAAAAAADGMGAHVTLGTTAAPQVRLTRELTRSKTRTPHRMPVELVSACGRALLLTLRFHAFRWLPLQLQAAVA
jgi:hypothetical protein